MVCGGAIEAPGAKGGLLQGAGATAEQGVGGSQLVAGPRPSRFDRSQSNPITCTLQSTPYGTTNSGLRPALRGLLVLASSNLLAVPTRTPF